MTVRTAEAEWQGTLPDGKGTMQLGGGAFEGAYSYGSRFDAPGDQPRGAAWRGSRRLFRDGTIWSAGRGRPYSGESLQFSRVHVGKTNGEFAIPKIELAVRGQVEGISDEDFVRYAQEAKANCPVSKALAGVEITLQAELEH